MQAKNLLIVVADEHVRTAAGCYGHPLVKTPNIDDLAARGTLFDAAYTNSPLCCPARAALATGRWPSRTGFWCNGTPYDATVPSWGHRMQENGIHTASIGKLHFRATEDGNGFDEEVIPLHVVHGRGDIRGMLRKAPPIRRANRQLAETVGTGNSTYIEYDRDIRDRTVRWLRNEAASHQNGWTLFVSFACPHFPLIAPPEFRALYDIGTIPLPTGRGTVPAHPVLKAIREHQNYDDFFRDDDHVREAIASYFALVSFLDDNVGQVMAALDAEGLTGETRVLYTSDHGDNLGNRGFWNKSTMYEESVGIPMILAGPGVPQGRRVATPVSLVDVFPTVLESHGLAPTDEDETQLCGQSLFGLAAGATRTTPVLMEYHAVSAITGVFALRLGRWKYVHYVGYPPQLFDLEADHAESCDLAGNPACSEVLAHCEQELRRLVDPEAATLQAFGDQEAMVARHGGETAVEEMGQLLYSPVPGEAVKAV